MRLGDTFCRQVADADPLGADRLLALLPRHNERADRRALVALLAELVAAAERAPLTGTAEQLAAVRDLGLPLGSLRRHGVEPLGAVPGAEPLLRRLGGSVGMVPRDTVLHYGAWNPTGARQRMYTGAAAESVLIHSVRVGAPSAERTALALAALSEQDPAAPEYADALAEAGARLRPLVESVDAVAEQVAPAEFFTARLRPFMQEVRVGTRAYYGPAAAHLPLHLVDQLLWAGDRTDPVHRGLQLDLLEYGLPQWSRLYRERTGRESVVSAVLRALRAAGTGAPTTLLRSAQAAAALLRQLVVFRGRHLRLVRAAYTEDGPFRAGSAGAAPELVRHLLDLTRERARQVAGAHSGTGHPVSTGAGPTP
ncbi:monodechloroaminopyrrolnitrin synthase PrnB [Streptomyces tateyamensis]|uniref:Monodechloroaminopyrrolnitrin synthase PrnB n=1 Tax=Streptomyces tateyamensis TaxID=565073 RepID=A0A2V4N0T0_9ACTN|nr:monodechloroaminopyrrolnitrin synthase PrnB family protein [Streptomyces tateyamensis]PYC67423.1 monodechloroaminopyrrolnitrin synthase PrnB [Streptomyces tateyamensis]